MTYATEGFLPRDTQKLALQRNLGDAMAAIIAKLFPHNAAKVIEAEYEIDRSSAKNVVKGTAGGAVIARMIHQQQRKHGNAWALWLALGELLIGEPLDAYEQREVLRLIEKTENAKSITEERRRRRAALAARSDFALSAEPRALAERPGRPVG
jgi:hypothetical protein